MDGYGLIEELKKTKYNRYIWKYYLTNEKRIIGSIKVKYKERELTLLNLNIEPEHRGKGLAKALLQIVIDKHGSKEELYIKPNPYKDQPVSRDKLEKFYQSFGFNAFGSEGKMKRDATNKGIKYC
jgi:GNAT superfamily N-acetyltransferase